MGGDINHAYRLQLGPQVYFVKVQQSAPPGFFEAEAEGLRALSDSDCVRVPEVYGLGRFQENAYLVLEWIALQPANSDAQAALGTQLARLHREPQRCFGGGKNNWIGTTPQPNPDSFDWVGFYREQRLGHQLRLAEQQGYSDLVWSAESVLDRFDRLFDGYQPEASLLHGDLWSGNQAMDERGRPVIFDPACWVGDREMDLAMTELFGGFDHRFYAAYEAEWPLDAGYASRRDLYQLYHVLNHVNLFGHGYLAQAQRLLSRLQATLDRI